MKLKRRSASLWGPPPSRFFRLLRLVESSIAERPIRVSILGCSDGKFVIPAARRGHRVLAVDIDPVALFGGSKPGVGGPVKMPGLTARLNQENLQRTVRVVHADFVTFRAPRARSHLVFTSGSIQYSYNLRHSLHAVIKAIQSFALSGGFVYVDYMLPLIDQHLTRPNFFARGALREHFPAPNWQIIYDRVLPPLRERAHVDNPEDHVHHWGHLLALRLR